MKMRIRHALIIGTMFGLTVGTIWGGGMVAFAQQPAPPDRPFTVTMPLSQWQTIVEALQDKNFKDRLAAFQSIQQQVTAQQAPPPEPPKPAPPAPETEPKKD